MREQNHDLKGRIAAARAEEKEEHPSRREKVMENTNLGVRVGTELAAAIIVGGVLGYALDIWLGTEPILFMGLLFLGIITGFVNVYRVVYGMRPLGDPARLRLRSDVTASRRDDDDKNSPDQE